MITHNDKISIGTRVFDRFEKEYLVGGYCYDRGGFKYLLENEASEKYEYEECVKIVPEVKVWFTINSSENEQE